MKKKQRKQFSSISYIVPYIFCSFFYSYSDHDYHLVKRPPEQRHFKHCYNWSQRSLTTILLFLITILKRVGNDKKLFKREQPNIAISLRALLDVYAAIRKWVNVVVSWRASSKHSCKQKQLSKKSEYIPCSNNKQTKNKLLPLPPTQKNITSLRHPLPLYLKYLP